MQVPKKIINPHLRHGYKWVPPDFEWLHDQYITQRKSARRIACEVGLSHRLVNKWLRGVNIPRRTKEEARTLQARSGVRRSKSWRREQARQTLRLLKVLKGCALCGTTKELLDVHHRDSNWRNNAPNNLQYLCHPCHMRLHAGWFITRPAYVFCCWQQFYQSLAT